MIQFEGRGGMQRLCASGIEARIANKCLGRVPGINYRQGRLTMPADARILEVLYLNGIRHFDASVQRWYREQLSLEKARAKLIAREDCEIAHSKSSQLLPFQRVGADYIARVGRTLLCDECGLGKTLEAIIATELSQQCTNVLVLCPNHLKLMWQDEKLAWSGRSDPITVFNTATRDKQQAAFTHGWAIVNYEQLRIACEDFLVQVKKPRGWRVTSLLQLREQCKYFDIQWDWLIIDEGHYLKNRRTQIYAAVQALRARHLVILTATPTGNDPSELWALLHLIDARRYRSYWRFYELYVDYVEDFFGRREILGVRHPTVLRRELASRMLRRTKKQVYPQLPDKRYQLVPLQMEEQQTRLYRSMAQKLYIELRDGSKLRARNVISKFTRLRQILSTPSAFGLPDTSCKLDYVVELLTATTEQVVVFTLFRATVLALSCRLTAKGISHVVMLGGQSDEKAYAAKKAFQNKEVRVFVSTLDAGGTGLDLRQADVGVVIFVDRHYNPMRQTQAEDRVHGIGQERKVHVYSLHCPGTVDAVVQDILERKVAMSNELLARSLLNELLQYLKKA